jgi:hypothetical protein
MKRKTPAQEARVRFQVPMHVGSQDQWFLFIRRRVQREAERLAEASQKLRKGDRLTKEECFDHLRRIAPDEEQLMREAVSYHVLLLGEAARAEAGFDLRIEPQQLEIGGARNWVFCFATMDASASRKLLQKPGVRETLVLWSENRGRPHEEFVGRRIDECNEEVLMDLLCAALPAATEHLAPSPAMIVDRFFDSPHFDFVCERNASPNTDEAGGHAVRLDERLWSTTPSSTKH